MTKFIKRITNIRKVNCNVIRKCNIACTYMLGNYYRHTDYTIVILKAMQIRPNKS